MPKFKVEIAIPSYTNVTVDADSEGQAKEKAMAHFNSEDGTCEIECQFDNAHVYEVEELT